MKLLVADPSEDVRHPARAVSDALIDLRPVLRVESNVMTVQVVVDAPKAAAAEYVMTQLEAAHVSRAVCVTAVLVQYPYCRHA